MTEVIARPAMSLDGYITGPDSGREHPPPALGRPAPPTS